MQLDFGVFMKEKIFSSLRILVAVFSLGVTVANAEQLGSDLDIVANKITAKGIAIKILSKAISPEALSQLKGEQREFVQKRFVSMISILNKSKIAWVGEGLQDFEGCRSDDYLGYVDGSLTSTIFICKTTLTKKPDYIAQVLIHESAHLAGEIDECRTTRWEVLAFRMAGLPLTHENGYMEHCKIH